MQKKNLKNLDKHIETSCNILCNSCFQIDEVDVNEQLTEMPFAAYQLTAMILNNEQLRKHFSSNAVKIFSSDMYKNVIVLLIIFPQIFFLFI